MNIRPKIMQISRVRKVHFPMLNIFVVAFISFLALLLLFYKFSISSGLYLIKECEPAIIRVLAAPGDVGRLFRGDVVDSWVPEHPQGRRIQLAPSASALLVQLRGKHFVVVLEKLDGVSSEVGGHAAQQTSESKLKA